MVLQVVPTHHGALLINSWLIFLKFCAVITGNTRRHLQLVQVAQVVRLLPIVCRASQQFPVLRVCYTMLHSAPVVTLIWAKTSETVVYAS